MHRPTRRHKHLTSKIEQKTGRTRRRGDKVVRGNKMKRWAKAAEAYKDLVTGD